jgi:hypothetical protein
MRLYETSAKVEDRGEVRVSGVPFAPGTEVEVTISPKRTSAEEFAAAWRELCAQLRQRPGLDLSDEQIGQEIHRHRAGQ